jgi:hypothetical protein
MVLLIRISFLMYRKVMRDEICASFKKIHFSVLSLLLSIRVQEQVKRCRSMPMHNFTHTRRHPYAKFPILLNGGSRPVPPLAESSLGLGSKHLATDQVDKLTHNFTNSI